MTLTDYTEGMRQCLILAIDPIAIRLQTITSVKKTKKFGGQTKRNLGVIRVRRLFLKKGSQVLVTIKAAGGKLYPFQ